MASNRSVRRAQEPVTYTCALCESADNVNWYCNDCQEALCDRCKEGHTRGRKTKNDDVVAIGRANRQEAKPVPEVCEVHLSKLCDFYCYDCNVLLCSICVSETHKMHNWKHFEEAFPTIKQDLKEHMTTISDKIAHFKNETQDRHRVNKAFEDNIDTMRQEVNCQRTKLKAEVDSIADAVLVELSSREKEESAKHKTDCERSEKNVEELTRLLKKAEMTDTTSVSTFEAERSLRTTLPLYDVHVKTVLPKQPSFVTGSIDRVMLTKMVGELHRENLHGKIDIDSKHVQRLSKFTQRNALHGIYAVDDSHAWLSIHTYQGLVLVNREGVVIETVKLNFCPFRIAMVGTTDILMTSYPAGTLVYKLSLHNKQVRTFADISPHQVCDISINTSGEVFVSTGTSDIVVLNQSGTIVRKLTCASKGDGITCLSSGIAVSVTDSYVARKIIITDDRESGTAIQTWAGELNSGQTLGNMHICRMACDQYDRLFVPDYSNNQVYVLPRGGTRATCLLDKTHGVVKPTAVGVDSRGNVWIGCDDGTVHVMRL